jgi:hypothetical protein
LSVASLAESLANLHRDDLSPKLIFVHGLILAIVTLAFFVVIRKI